MEEYDMRKMRRKLAVLLVFVLAFTMMPQNVLAAKKKVKLSKKSVTVTVGKTVKVKLKNNKKKVKWTVVSGKKNVKLSKKKKTGVTIHGKKAGKAIVTVKKVAGAEGYQVQYSLKKSMKSAKNVKIKKNSITIKRLKKGKTYYVRVRAFSKDSNGKQICTAWSTAKKVTIKK